MDTREAGRLGGSSRSERKCAASRRNGALSQLPSTAVGQPGVDGPGRWRLTIDGKRTAEYQAFLSARNRCTNPGIGPNWKLYGGRGIEFRFQSFDDFMDEIGQKPTPKHQLDRINNDGHYEKGNVRWSTPAENTNNRRCSTHEFRSPLLDIPPLEESAARRSVENPPAARPAHTVRLPLLFVSRETKC